MRTSQPLLSNLSKGHRWRVADADASLLRGKPIRALSEGEGPIVTSYRNKQPPLATENLPKGPIVTSYLSLIYDRNVDGLVCTLDRGHILVRHWHLCFLHVCKQER